MFCSYRISTDKLSRGPSAIAEPLVNCGVTTMITLIHNANNQYDWLVWNISATSQFTCTHRRTSTATKFTQTTHTHGQWETFRANHVFHADADLAIAVESSIEADNVWRIALMKYHQLTNDLIANSRLDLQVYQLQQHINTTLYVLDSLSNFPLRNNSNNR